MDINLIWIFFILDFSTWRIYSNIIEGNKSVI